MGRGKSRSSRDLPKPINPTGRKNDRLRLVVDGFRKGSTHPTIAPLPRRRAIQSHVECQHVHARLTEQAKKTTFGVFLDELADAIFRRVAGFRNTWDLEKRRLRRNM